MLPCHDLGNAGLWLEGYFGVGKIVSGREFRVSDNFSPDLNRTISMTAGGGMRMNWKYPAVRKLHKNISTAIYSFIMMICPGWNNAANRQR